MRGFKKNTRGVENNTLSEEQKIILDYLTIDFMTVKQIAKKRGTSRQATYKTISKLKEKGYLKHRAGGFNGGLKIKGVRTLNSSPLQSDNINKIYRLHGQNFTIKILNSSQRYTNLIKNRNKDEIDNNTLMLESDNITIYLNKDFWGEEPNESVKLSLLYVERLIVRIENAYNITLQTKTRCDIKYFRGHIAKTGDPYARKINLEDDKLKIYDDMGVLRLLVDKSFNYDELEAVSMKHNKDMNRINDKWLDLIKTDLKLSDVEQHLSQMQKYQLDNEVFKNEILLMIKALALKIK